MHGMKLVEKDKPVQDTVVVSVDILQFLHLKILYCSCDMRKYIIVCVTLSLRICLVWEIQGNNREVCFVKLISRIYKERKFQRLSLGNNRYLTTR